MTEHTRVVEVNPDYYQERIMHVQDMINYYDVEMKSVCVKFGAKRIDRIGLSQFFFVFESEEDLTASLLAISDNDMIERLVVSCKLAVDKYLEDLTYEYDKYNSGE